MFEDSLWYLIVIGGFGLVLVFVGCFIVPVVSYLFKWRYPPLSEEEEMQLKDANDPKLQALFQLLEKNAMNVSKVDLNKVPQKKKNDGVGALNLGEPDRHPQHASESNRSVSLSLSNKPPSKRRSIRDYVCTNISTILVAENNKRNKSSTPTNKAHKSAPKKRSDGDGNDDEHDIEAGNSGSRLNIKGEEQQQQERLGNPLEEEDGHEQTRISHSSLNSHGNKHNCAICLEEYQSNRAIVADSEIEEQVICATGGCIHYFHLSCMKSLIRSRARKGSYEVVPCPICRLPFLAPNSWNMQLRTCCRQATTSTPTTNADINHNGDDHMVEPATTRPVPVAAEIGNDEVVSTRTGNVISVVVSAAPIIEEAPLSPPAASVRRSQSSSLATNRNPKEDFNADDSFVNTRLPEFAGGTPPKNRKGKRKSSKKEKTGR